MKTFIKKLSLFLIILWGGIILLPISTNATEDWGDVVNSGTCGENLIWEYTSDKVLIISGTGEMDNYTYYNSQDATDAPWDEARRYIKRIVIKEGVTSVGKSAFWECEQLEEVMLGDDVAVIQENAFWACRALRTITIGKGLKRVENYAFMSCDSLFEVYGSDLINWCEIEFRGAYSNPASVKPVYENGGWAYYDAVLYLEGIPLEDELVIPATVADWGIGSFQDYRALKTVIISEGVTSIGAGAFGGCENLTNLTISESVHTIEDGAFAGCGFTSIDIPKGVEKLGNSAFESCAELEKVMLPSSLKEIGSKAFSNCALEEVDIPESVTVIGDGVFQKCLFTEISVPDSVSSFGNSVFKNCTNLNSVKLSENLESIGNETFYGCTSLENIALPNGVKSIGTNAFVGCSKLKRIILSDELVEIGENAFKDLTALTDMELPDSVITIGASAFKNLSSWGNAKIPANVESIGEYAYSGCITLSAIELPDSVISVGKYAFENCSQASEIMLSNNLGMLSESIFTGCNSFENIIIPAAVQEIGDKAFSGCSQLKAVYFEGDAPVLSETAFNGVVATCYYPKGNETYTAEIRTEDFGGDLLWTYEGEEKPEDFQKCGESIIWEITESGILVLSGTGAMYDYSANELVYAPWYEQRNSIVSIQIGEGITHIGDCAFYECSTATAVTMPSTLTSIGNSAFYSCGITSVSLPDGLAQIGESAFYGTKITDVTIPDSVVEAGISAFQKTLLTNVVLPKNLAHIPDRMFSQCHYLYTVKFPEKLISIGDSAFTSCFSLNSVVLPEGLVSIGEQAFALCGACDSYGFYYPAYSFSSVTLPSTVKEIGYGAFWRCEYLKTINIPESMETIGDYAFAYCFDLRTVTFEWNSPVIGTQSTFIQVKATCYYPSNNPNWNTSIMQNYGGTLTWVAQEMELPGGGSGGNTGEDSGEPGENEGGSDSGESGGNEGGEGSGNTGGGSGESGGGSEGGGNTGEGEGTGGSDHTFGEWSVTKEASCTEKGEKIRSCTHCDYVEIKEIPATDHTYEEEVTEPTCEEAGYTTHTCSTCGDSYVDGEVESLGHNFGEWSTTKETSCTETGEAKRNCARCDYFEIKEIEAKDHAYEEEVTEPTCEAGGYITHTCSACGDSYIDSEVKSLGHNLSDWSTTKEAGCEETGETKRNCARCDYFETKEIEATGHGYEEKVTEPTCKAGGYTTHTCSACGGSYIDSEEEALGHSFTNYISDNNATTESAGTLTAKCDCCDATDTIPDPAGPIIPEVPENNQVIRLAGATRYETGYKVADVLKERLGIEQFEAVVIATGKNFADALSGSYLATIKNAPILLTNGKTDNIETLHNYIKENVIKGGRVYILGGAGAVPVEVESIEGYDVVRLSGATRYETNLAILNEAGIKGDELIVATGKTFADSLSASATRLPILLVKPDMALSEAAKEIAVNMNKIYVIGGESAVSGEIEAELKNYAEVVRIFGNSRYETSVAVANTFFGEIEEVVVASGKNFPDGLCGGALAAAIDAPLILTTDGKINSAVEYVQKTLVDAGYVLGGTGALGDNSVVDIFALEAMNEIVLR